MKVWKQIITSAALVLAASLVWLKVDPNAAARLSDAGIPVPALLKNNDEAASSASQSGPAGAQGNRQGGSQGGGQGSAQGRGGGRAASVIVATVAQGIVNDRFSAIGTGAPARTVSVQPQVSGQIASIEATSGSTVNEGDVIARLTSDDQEIARDRAKIAVETAEDKLKRMENLLRQRTVSSVDADTAKTDLENAQLALRQAELDLERRTIRAPISGTIGILGINRGDYVTTSTVISTIDDRESIVVEFYVPEKLVGSIGIGTPVAAQSIARPGETFDGAVAALDNRLDEASRTLRVRASIPNQDDRLRAGMSFQVRMRFEGESYPSVDPLAIQWSSDGSFVWRIKDGKAERVAASIIQRNADYVLVDAKLEPGDQIVTEGVQNVRAGGDVNIVNAGPAGTDASGGGKKPAAGSNDASSENQPRKTGGAG